MGLNTKTMKSTGGGGTDFPIVPKGNYMGRLVQILDLGLQAQRPYQGKPKKPVYKFWLTYELPTKFLKDEDGNDMEDKPHWVSEEISVYPLSVENATSTARANALDPDLVFDGDWEQMLGLPCMIGIVHKKSKANGKTYANIGSVTPEMDGMETPPMIGDAKIFDLDNPDMEIFDALPEFLQKKITTNLEFDHSPLQKALHGEAVPAKAEPKPEPKADAPAYVAGEADDWDDDIPF